jgi:hypothetical protein
MARVPGLRLSDPTYLRIKELILSPEGRKLMVAAVAANKPALAGVDPLLKADLKERYNKEDLGTASAGDIVANAMRSLGYTEAGQGVMPPECVARTGLKWKPKV